jgi:sensor histidine kinase YesM
MRCSRLHKKKKQALAVRLPSYKPVNILVRFVIVSLIAVAILHLIVFVFAKSGWAKEEIPVKTYLITIFSFNALAELQIVFDNIFERFFPVPQKLRLRIFLQLIVAVLFIVLATWVLFLLSDPKLTDVKARPGVLMGMLSGLLFVQLLASSLTTARLTRKWIDSQKEIAEMKSEKLKMDYLLLQDQLNPHFLFNNLSVLKSLIIYDKDTAVNFTENFTDVYRYVLQSKERRLVKLSEEFEFLRAYYSLHKERLGDGLQSTYSINDASLDKDIAPLTGQLLVENAIKHNVTSRENPLKLNIETTEEWLIVSNKINLKSESYSTKTGLKNLIKRYEMLTDNKIVVNQTEDLFEVRIPLL